MNKFYTKLMIGVLLLALFSFIPQDVDAACTGASITFGLPNTTLNTMSGANFTVVATHNLSSAMDNASLYYQNRSVGVGSSTAWIFVGNASNNSLGQVLIGLPTTTLVTGNYTINVSYSNSTKDGSCWDSKIVNVFINNNAPATTYESTNPADGLRSTSTSQSFKLDADLSRQTCIFYFGITPTSIINTTTVTPATNGTCILDFSQLPQSAYDYKWASSNGLNWTNTSVRTLNGLRKSSIIPALDQQQDQKTQQTQQFLLVAAVIVAVWYFTRKK